jgi:VWFA-related protein
MRVWKQFFFVILLAALIIAPVFSARAQSGLAIRVSQIATIETPDSMTLKAYFNVYDPKTGLPVLETIAETAQVNLPNTNYAVDVRVQKPDVPIYVVLVLDASGSMARAAEDLKKSAKLALNNTPDNAFFSVVQFDEEIRLLQDYTQNIAAVSFAIDQYKVSNKGTCLYDATFSAAESLQKAPPGRRAIILFTDGRDENASGQPCSKKTYLEVSDFAQKTQIPVNTVGLSSRASNLNEVELKGLAASTGAFSVIATTDDLAVGFQSILDGLKAQWMVQAEVYPKKGNNQVVLTLNLKDNELLSTTFSIESNTEYEGPPSPVKGQFAGLQFVPEDQTYNIQLSMTSSELVEYIKVEVWDTKGGSKVAEFTFDGLQQNNVLTIPTDQLVVGRDYQLRLTAVSRQDKSRFTWFTDKDGKKSVELVHQFVFDPTANLPALGIQAIAQQDNDLVLSVKTTNSQLIGGFDGWLVDEASNTKLQGSDFTGTAEDAAAGKLVIPLSKSKVPDGKYTVIVRVLGKEQQVYTTAQYPGVVYQAKRQNIFQLLTAALIAAPIILFMVVAIILGVVGFMMYSSRREKSMTGTPVLQGRLGGKLGNGKKGGGPVIPVADDEPLLARKQGATPLPPAPVSQAPRPVVPPQQPPRPSADATIISGNSPDATMLSPVSGAPQRPALVIIQAPPGSFGEAKIQLGQFPVVIGRTDGSLLIKDSNLSRRHAEITFDAARNLYAISDLNSSNGTYVNGQRIPAGQPVQLYNGAVINFGPNVSVRFEIG